MNGLAALGSAWETATAVAPQKPWKIYLSGGMRMVGPQGDDVLPSAKKTRALLAYLCLEHPKRVSRSRLAALLWDKVDQRARRNLRDALYELEKAINAKSGGLIRLEHEFVALNLEVCWVDVLTEPDCHVDRLLDGFGDISEEFDDWLRAERCGFENRVRETLWSQVAALSAESTPPESRAAAARKLVIFDPTHEAGVCVLMQAMAELGQPAQALREYRHCSEELDKIDTSPSPELTRLYNAIRSVTSRPASGVAAPPTADLVPLPQGKREIDRTRDPRVAVLPFHNLSGDKRHDLTADGLADNLIWVLGRVPGFFVISRLTTRVFRNQDRLPQDLGDVLDVRYIVSGSIHVANSRVAVIVELADAIKGIAIWSERIEECFTALIDVQMRLAEAIVERIAPRLRLAELTRIRGKRPEQLTAQELFLRAQDDMHNTSRAVFNGAELLFKEAIARDPTYADPLAWLAYMHVLRIGQGWSSDPVRDSELAAVYARRAIECDPYEPMGFAVAGHLESYVRRDFDTAFDYFDKAIRLNPNDAPAHLWKAAASAWCDDGPAAVEEAGKAMALSPYDPLSYVYNAVAGMGHLAAGQYEQAVECSYRALRDNRSYSSGYRQLVIALTLAGHTREAASATRRLIDLEPRLTVEGFRARYPGRDSARTPLYCEALAAAGVPPRG